MSSWRNFRNNSIQRPWISCRSIFHSAPLSWNTMGRRWCSPLILITTSQLFNSRRKGVRSWTTWGRSVRNRRTSPLISKYSARIPRRVATSVTNPVQIPRILWPTLPSRISSRGRYLLSHLFLFWSRVVLNWWDHPQKWSSHSSGRPYWSFRSHTRSIAQLIDWLTKRKSSLWLAKRSMITLLDTSRFRTKVFVTTFSCNSCSIALSSKYKYDLLWRWASARN